MQAACKCHAFVPAARFIYYAHFKDAQRMEWEATKTDLINRGNWANNANGSGKLKNPGKHIL